jgi:Kef-type K+ transport system membrane component KefB
LFASIFFTSLGLHVFPSFLAQQAGLLMLISIFIMGFKVIIAINTLHILLGMDVRRSLAIGLSLSQVSEFAFVLASKGKKMGILTKEAYYLLIGATSITLVVTPFVWPLVKSSTHRKSALSV